MKDLRNRFCHCKLGLTEDFAVFKGNRLDEKMVPLQISNYKAKYYSYFGEGDIKWNTESPEYDVVPYDEYSSRLVKLRKRLKDIETLKNSRTKVEN